MRTAHPVSVVRAAERPLIEAAEAAGDPDAVMRRAATGVAHHTAALLRSRGHALHGARVLLLVGSGDNGGDALYAGARLRARGCAVDALLTAPGRVHARGLAALRRAGGRVWDGPGAVTARAGEWDVAVDGVVGLSGTGPLREPAGRVVAALEAAGVPLVAVDLPSGVDADTGVAYPPHVRAAVTVTFGLLRRAHLLAAPECGRVELVDIGPMDVAAGEGPHDAETVSAPDAAEVGARWPVPGAADDKYSQGVVAVRAGSGRYPGAAVLCASAAVAATSGMVRYVGPCGDAVLARRPEVVRHPTVREAGRAQAWVAGPGMGTDDDAVAGLDAILSLGTPVLVDADGLAVLAEHPGLLRGRDAPVLLTPHAGEFARLAGREVGPDRAGSLRGYVTGLRARGVDATVLLKGRVTLVDDGERLLAVDAGASWGATAGSGDVLSGVAGALLAHGAAAPDGPGWVARVAADAAVAHAAAARHAAAPDGPGTAGAPIGASELLGALHPAIRGLRATRDADG